MNSPLPMMSKKEDINALYATPSATRRKQSHPHKKKLNNGCAGSRMVRLSSKPKGLLKQTVKKR